MIMHILYFLIRVIQSGTLIEMQFGPPDVSHKKQKKDLLEKINKKSTFFEV